VTDPYASALTRHRDAVARGEQAFLNDLFNVPEPAARHSDPATSHEAAASMADEADHQRATVLAALHDFGPMSNDQLDQQLGWRVGTASRRTAELLKVGLVRRTDTRVPTRTGRAAFLLEAA